jgi:hypothetical protein
LRAYYCKAFNASEAEAEVTEPPAQPSITGTPLDFAHPHVSREDIEAVLKKIERGKAAGIDGMRSDVLCDLRVVPAFVDTLFTLINVMIHTGFWPTEWNQVLIAPLLKPGKDPLEADSYRPIHLICVLAKVVSRLVEQRIFRNVGSPDCQLAYMSNHGTRDNIYVLNTLIDKYKSVGIYCVFVDFTAALDKIDRKLLIDKLRGKGALDATFLTFLTAMLTGVNASVKASVFRWFNEGLGVKQGDPSGPRTFVTYIHDLPEYVCVDNPEMRPYAVFLVNQLIRSLLWADDLVLFSLNEEHMQQQLNALAAFCNANKLCVNRKKTEVMYINTRVEHIPDDLGDLHVFTYDGTPLKNVSKYKYVGTWVDNKGSCEVQVKELLAKANKAMYKCMSKARRLSARCPPSLRVLLFKSYVCPILTYGGEVIPYTCKHINSMNAIIIKYARWASGLPSSTCVNAVMREVGLRPAQYDLLQAKMNYYLLLMTRASTHVTRLALDDMQSRADTSAYNKWVQCIVAAYEKLRCQELLNVPAARSNKSIIRKLVHELWLREGGASMIDIVNKEVHTHYLSGIRARDTCLSTVYTTRLNTLSVSASRISLHTQLVDAYKYGGKGRCHLLTTYIKRYEQEALSLFRTGVAPCFVKRNAGAYELNSNRILRICTYCKLIHGSSYINDAFHILFVCPIVAEERQVMWSDLQLRCGSDEWMPAATVCDLGVSLLCPQNAEVACTVGRLLSVYLAASEMYETARTDASIELCIPRWLGGNKSTHGRIKSKLHTTLQMRMSNVLPFSLCTTTCAHVRRLAREDLHDAFKPIESWLVPGWAHKIEKSKKRKVRSIAIF